MKWNPIVLPILIMTTAASLTHRAWAASFGDDAAFLKSHTELIVLSDEKGQAKVAVAPAWQGRVMTSTAGADAGLSFGWINRELIASGKTAAAHERVRRRGSLLDGAGGRAVLDLLRQGAKFEFADWFTPAVFDTLPFKVVSQSKDKASVCRRVRPDQLLRHALRGGGEPRGAPARHRRPPGRSWE